MSLHGYLGRRRLAQGRLVACAATLALIGGCASDGGGGSVSTSMHVGVGYGSYYGPGWYGGYYAPWEATTNFSPVILEIAGTLDGKPFSSRSVYSPTLELHTGKLELPKYAAVVAEAMRMAHVELVAALRARRAAG